MTNGRRDGLLLLVLGSVVLIFLGAALGSATGAGIVDFRSMYFSTRCLIQHGDPYTESAVFHLAQAEGGTRPWDSVGSRHIMQYIYLPTTFPVNAAFAVLPWGFASALWMALSIGGLIFASWLIWTAGAQSAPDVSGILIGFLIGNAELLMVTGNAAGLAISLCAVGVWCIFRERFVWAGMVCLAVSLAIKPQDAGLVWLYFALAGGVYRKRALQTLLLTFALGLPGVVWVGSVAPQWRSEWHSAVQMLSAHAAMSDPGPASAGAHGIGMMLGLQTVFSVFRDDPRFYDWASYLICAPLLLLWIFITLLFRPTPKRTWLALAAIAPLSMLILYHRQIDALLLLLTVPACAQLWAEGRRTGRIALPLTMAGFLVAGYLPWAILLGLLSKLHLSGVLMLAAQAFPAPLTLLILSIFYLWVYLRHCLARQKAEPHVARSGVVIRSSSVSEI
ncbi:MAG: glycosyltransferase family 87 protein [Terracidiphilus sp.]